MFVFEWDELKAQKNLKKHGVSFEEALGVFDDPQYSLYADDESSEERFIAIGLSQQSNLIVVVHCYREHNLVRIISARKATRKEKKSYEEGI